MALSPADYKAASANNNAIVANAKALTILSSNANSKPSTSTSATADLSEQLNEETRHRYEKGMLIIVERAKAVVYAILTLFGCLTTLSQRALRCRAIELLAALHHAPAKS